MAGGGSGVGGGSMCKLANDIVVIRSLNIVETAISGKASILFQFTEPS